jgi:hypothetical protein
MKGAPGLWWGLEVEGEVSSGVPEAGGVAGPSAALRFAQDDDFGEAFA